MPGGYKLSLCCEYLLCIDELSTQAWALYNSRQKILHIYINKLQDQFQEASLVVYVTSHSPEQTIRIWVMYGLDYLRWSLTINLTEMQNILTISRQAVPTEFQSKTQIIIVPSCISTSLCIYLYLNKILGMQIPLRCIYSFFFFSPYVPTHAIFHKMYLCV